METSLKFWQVDSFTDQPFTGNPAAVFILDEEIPDNLMQNIAIEMNLSETAFILLRDDQNPLLRWFTSKFEIDLCGHATLAAAHIYLTEIQPNLNEVNFDTKFVGPLTVEKIAQSYRMTFPIRAGDKKDINAIPTTLLNALSNEKPIDAYQARDLMLVYDNADTIRQMSPDFNILKKFKVFLMVTAPSDDKRYDFISRFFCPEDAIVEDPVTGSAHCTATPYWSKRLNKKLLKAFQASQRGGELELEINDTHVLITGKAITILNGHLNI